jgi:hypothetical protein
MYSTRAPLRTPARSPMEMARLICARHRNTGAAKRRRPVQFMIA